MAETIEQASDKIKQLQNLEKAKLKEKGYLDNYGGEVKITQINNNLFSVEGKNGNIVYYIDDNGNRKLSVLGISKLKNYVEYCKKLGVVEEKDDKGVYHMYKLDKDGKKTPIDKYSEAYFNVWKEISSLQGRDIVLHVYKGNKKNTVMRLEDKGLELMLNDKCLRLIDLVIFKSKGNITQEQFDVYKDKVASILLEQVKMNSLFGKMPDTEIKFNFNGREYKLHTSYITQDELDYYLNTNLITKKIYDDCTRELKAEQEVSKLKTKEQKNIVSAELDDLRKDIVGIA